MEIHPILNADNQVFAFEIDNTYIRPRKVAGILESIVNVTDVDSRRLFDRSTEIHVQFKYRSFDFIVRQPYGDNSKYWVGPKKRADNSIDIRDIENAFTQYTLPIAMKVFGDLISLNLKSLFGARNAP